MIPRLALPPRPAVLALLALAFALPGLIGHDPWKSLDAITIEIAHQMAVTGDWLVPRLAGEPWMSQAPLYPWVGALLGMLLGPFIPFHGAVRLASALFMLGALLPQLSTDVSQRMFYLPMMTGALLVARIIALMPRMGFLLGESIFRCVSKMPEFSSVRH